MNRLRREVFVSFKNKKIVIKITLEHCKITVVNFKTHISLVWYLLICIYIIYNIPFRYFAMI